MNENQQIEHRQIGDVRASIRAITTQYGELRTVVLHREWTGRDGEKRYADDLRLHDLPEAMALLDEILGAEKDSQDQEASHQEAPGTDEDLILDLPPSPALKRRGRRDPFPRCDALQKQPPGYASNGIGLCPEEAASTDPHTWKYDEAELACWSETVSRIQADPDHMVREIVSG